MGYPIRPSPTKPTSPIGRVRGDLFDRLDGAGRVALRRPGAAFEEPRAGGFTVRLLPWRCFDRPFDFELMNPPRID